VSTETEIRQRIQELKEARNAVILVHNYQAAELQEIADYLGDSLGLSRQAADSDAEVIVFCGVHFMAETASILCPNKTVLLPDPNSGCPMANMITAEQLRALKRQHPHAVVVCYVNSTAEVKAESELCCTSANASDIVESVEAGRPIIFVPDKFLGAYTAALTGRELILWDGYCPTHVCIRPQDIHAARRAHPDALVMVHPECRPDVTALADAVESTGGMCRVARESEAREFIVGTELGMLTRLKTDNPEKDFYPASPLAVCPNMKRNSLEKVLWSLEELAPEVRVPADVAERARGALDAMVAAGGPSARKQPVSQ